jgi:protein SCO1/2
MPAGLRTNERSGSRLNLQIFCGVFLLCSVLLCGCSKTAPTASKFPTYKMRGTIVAVHADDKSASIDAEAIPGFMDAMTMEYTIRDSAALSKLKPKDKITADLIVGPDGAYIENVQIQPAP